MSYAESIETNQRGSPSVGVPEHCLPVLVIDDNEGDRRLAALQLGAVWPFDRDLKVECAADGETALEMIHTGQFKLIVLDWNLPDISGAEILRMLYRHRVAAPVIVLSGLHRADLHEDIESFGATFLNKDEMTPMTLSKAVGTAITLSRRRHSTVPVGVVQPLGQMPAVPAA